MRIAIMIFALLAQTAGSAAKEPASEIFLSKAGDLATIGEASSGETRAYFLKVLANGPVKFLLNAENDTCGYDISKSSQLGVLPSFGRFPVRHDETGMIGDVYTISFFQTRMAWIDKKACSFSFSLQ